MSSKRKFWYCAALCVIVQLMMLYGLIYREHTYVTALYNVQKCEQFHTQLTHEHTKLNNELQKIRNLAEIKLYAEDTLGLQQLPLNNFYELHENSPL